MFQGGTELVLVPTVVRDGHGNPATGLTRDDFEVRENNARQKIAVFEEIKTSGGAKLQRGAAAPGVYTNQLHGAAEQTPRLNIIVLDTMNTPVLYQLRARLALIKFLAKSVDPDQMTALITLDANGIRVIHDFTTDTRVLVAALQKVSGAHAELMSGARKESESTGNSTGGLDVTGGLDATDTGVNSASSEVNGEANQLQAFVAYQAEMARMMQQLAIQYTLDGFAQIARSFGPIPGRKSLIWVTGSFPFLLTSPDDPPESRGFNDQMAEVFQMLNDADIAVYPVDARGLVLAEPDAAWHPQMDASIRALNRGKMATAAINANESSLQTMANFAELTGGRAFVNGNDLGRALASAADDSSSYYVLGYYRPAGDNKPGWRRIQVKVRKHGMKVRARRGYFVTAAATAAARDLQDVQLALVTPLDFTAIPAALEWGTPAAAEGGKKSVPFVLEVAIKSLEVDTAEGNHVNFSVYAEARTADGKPAAGLEKTVDLHLKPETPTAEAKGGINFRDALQLMPGEYSVRFVVRDGLNGNIGSLLAPLKVE